MKCFSHKFIHFFKIGSIIFVQGHICNAALCNGGTCFLQYKYVWILIILYAQLQSKLDCSCGPSRQNAEYHQIKNTCSIASNQILPRAQFTWHVAPMQKCKHCTMADLLAAWQLIINRALTTNPLLCKLQYPSCSWFKYWASLLHTLERKAEFWWGQMWPSPANLRTSWAPSPTRNGLVNPVPSVKVY